MVAGWNGMVSEDFLLHIKVLKKLA